MCDGGGPNGAQPSARGRRFKQRVSGVGGLSHNRSCMSPGGAQVLERWQIAANLRLSSPDGTLQPGLVLHGGGRVPDGDGNGEDGLDEGSGEVHHHCVSAAAGNTSSVGPFLVREQIFCSLVILVPRNQKDPELTFTLSIIIIIMHDYS